MSPRRQAKLVRRCVTCRGWAAKIELIRVTRLPTGDLQIDTTGTLPGRGAYVHKSPTCLSEALRKRHLERALKRSLPPDLTAALASMAEEYSAMAEPSMPRLRSND